MIEPNPYGRDLAHIHDDGYGGFARNSAPGLLALLRRSGITHGRIVELGCGSGILAKKLAHAGYQSIGVDISAAMVKLARQRVPQATFHTGSLFAFRFPSCEAVTALGEVFNYRFDSTNSVASLRHVYRNIFDALQPGGLLVFDVAQPGRCRGREQAFAKGKNWVCLVQLEHDTRARRLTRRITTFRKAGRTYRRTEEVHCQQLYEPEVIRGMLEDSGFDVRRTLRFGLQKLPEHVTGFIARKPRIAESH
jgi:SAM-dependent methyltransferase